MTSATAGGETWTPAAAPALRRPRRRVREGDVPRVRLAQHVVTLADGHQVSLAVAGLRVPGIVIKDPGCVAKTYPGFFEDLEKLRCA